MALHIRDHCEVHQREYDGPEEPKKVKDLYTWGLSESLLNEELT